MTQNAITAETHPLINVIEENKYENKNHLKLDNLSSKRIVTFKRIHQFIGILYRNGN